ncbi:hypothetical protein AMTRI_Chr05g65450 [Amborella trichopoda]
MEKFMKNMTDKTTSTTNRTLRIKNKEEIIINDIENQIQNWNIPKVPISDIYKKGTFDLKIGYAIKTVEETLSVTSNQKDFQLLSQKILQVHKNKNYKYLHIGLIQIAVKPLTRLGLNNSILVCLRDTRHNRFSDSLLGMVESSLCSGPIYFNCFPNYSVSLTDPNILNVLSLNPKTQGFDMITGSQIIAIVYRIYYKVMTTLCPNVLQIDTRGQTIFFQTNMEKSNTIIPKTISWSDIILPQTWSIHNENQPSQNPIQNIPDKIIEYTDGNIEIQFTTNNRIMDDASISETSSTHSFREPEPPRKSITTYNRIPSIINIPSTPVKPQIDGLLRTSDNIIIPQYRKAEGEPAEAEFIQVLQLEETFTKEDIINDFLSPENKNIREWYVKEFEPRLVELFHSQINKWRKKGNRGKCFFTWLRDTLSQHNIPIPDFEINTLKTQYTVFNTTEGNTIKSIHPPEQSLKIQGVATTVPTKKTPEQTVGSSSTATQMVVYETVATPYKLNNANIARL